MCVPYDISFVRSVDVGYNNTYDFLYNISNDISYVIRRHNTRKSVTNSKIKQSDYLSLLYSVQ